MLRPMSKSIRFKDHRAEQELFEQRALVAAVVMVLALGGVMADRADRAGDGGVGIEARLAVAVLRPAGKAPPKERTPARAVKTPTTRTAKGTTTLRSQKTEFSSAVRAAVRPG